MNKKTLMDKELKVEFAIGQRDRNDRDRDRGNRGDRDYDRDRDRGYKNNRDDRRDNRGGNDRPKGCFNCG
jgi:hypothetical protein